MRKMKVAGPISNWAVSKQDDNLFTRASHVKVSGATTKTYRTVWETADGQQTLTDEDKTNYRTSEAAETAAKYLNTIYRNERD